MEKLEYNVFLRLNSTANATSADLMSVNAIWSVSEMNFFFDVCNGQKLVCHLIGVFGSFIKMKLD